MGIAHAAIAPVIVIAGVKPNLVLVGVVLATCLLGFLPGITWAFIGGLTANLLTSEPLGAMPLAMLLAAAVTAGGATALGRMSWVYPVLAAFVGSLVADLVTIGVTTLVAGSGAPDWPVTILLPAAVLNAAICGVLIVPARLAAMRYAGEEPGW